MLTDPAAKPRPSHVRVLRVGVATAVLLACSPLTVHAQYVASSTSSVQVDTSVLETLGAPQTIADLMLPMASRPASQRPGVSLPATGTTSRQGLLPDPRRAPQSELLVSPGKPHTAVAQTRKPHKPSVAVTIPAPPQQASYTPPADIPAATDAGQAEATAQARAIAAAKQELAERDRIAKADQIAAQRATEAQEQHLKEQQAKEQAAKEQATREADLKAAADAEAEAQAKAAQEQAAAQAEASRKAEEQAAEQAQQAQQAAKARADAEAREAQAQADADRRAAEQAAAEQAARKAQSAKEMAVAALPSAPIVPNLPSAAPAKTNSTAAPAYSSGESLTIPFASNAADIPAQSGSALESIVQKLNSNPEMSARIQAYAAGDESSVSKARRLSLSRALAIRSYLLDRGIAPTRIEVRALGTPTKGNPDRVDVEMVKS